MLGGVRSVRVAALPWPAPVVPPFAAQVAVRLPSGAMVALPCAALVVTLGVAPAPAAVAAASIMAASITVAARITVDDGVLGMVPAP